MNQLEKVLKKLKRRKSRDPYGYCNELFMPEAAGDDLKNAILKMMNISSIWKKKGSRNKFDSY